MLSRTLNRIFQFLRISRQPVIKAYDGFGDHDEILVQGHLLRVSPMDRKRLRNNFLFNFFGLIRLFIVRPVPEGTLELDWFGERRQTVSEKDGYFRFEWKPQHVPEPGWHKTEIRYIAPLTGLVACTGSCDVFIPHKYQYGFISDIDDTFLISHSASLWKRLRVLFTRNAASREPFQDVVRHYQLLARAGAATGPDNPFFFVSSSEWNLYDYIRYFCRKQELPRGVFMLSQMKRLSQIFQTAQGKHSAKYIRIVRILKSFPHHKYILMGDNTQMDPEIYDAVVKDFRENIFAVYIRDVVPRNDHKTREHLAAIEKRGVMVCYFKNSKDAIEHSRRAGLI